ncbi:fibrillin-1-like, partial [Mercenaria mercenaria]|uniref:fibrillin-1-like n=1 Tax=Mercenaria mercenaria TaxID=6596 RepID=UPI00234EE6E8
LEEAFKGSNGVTGIPGFKSVEVIRIILVLGGNRRKREDSKSNKVQAEYIVHIRKNETETSDTKKLTTALQNAFSSYMESNKSSTIEIGNLKVQASADLHVYDVEKNGLCMIPNRTDCDTKSTICKNTFGGFECVCNPGYKPFLRYKKSCEDKDECAIMSSNEKEVRCVHGTCLNTVGAWNCTCPSSRQWQYVGNETYSAFRCQGNYSYVGEANIKWTENYTNTDAALTKAIPMNAPILGEVTAQTNVVCMVHVTIPSDLGIVNVLQVERHRGSVITRTKSTDVKISTLFLSRRRSIESFQKENPPMHDIFQSVEILNTTIVENSDYATVNITYVLHIGESVLIEWVQKFQQNVFNKSAPTKSDGNVTVTFLRSSIHNDLELNLCTIPNRTNCDLSSTNCTVHNGSYSCPCKSGYHTRLDDYHCKDIDECTEKNVTCNSGKCTNTVGSWKCDCDEGSEFRRINDSFGECGDIDECKYNDSYVCNFGTCHNHKEGWNCICENGYHPQEIVPNKIYTCVDKDECIEKSVTCRLGDCINTVGSWECDCDEWSEFKRINDTFGEYKDINECDNNSSYVCKLGTCHDKAGGWNCSCIAGFYPQEIVKNKIYTCTDKDECIEKSVTCKFGDCINTVGSWECDCDEWSEFKRINDTFGECKDIDECKSDHIYICSNGGSCVNTPGKWNCECPAGFKVNSLNESFIECKDIDECDEKNVKCQFGNCNNTVGSWECLCDEWSMYQRINNTFGVCEDIDECDIAMSCLDASGCVNTHGSWKCVCSEGLKETAVNKTSKVCAGDYQYVASVNFTITGKVTDVGELQKAIKKKILDMYMSTFTDDDSIWIEIIKINGLPGSSRKKRSIIHRVTTDYIIHTFEPKSQKELNNVEKVYRAENCNNRTAVCEDHIDGLLVELSGVQTKNASAICGTIKNLCDKSITTCSSTNGQLQCKCKQGYKKTPGDENSLLCTDIDECENKIQPPCPNGTTCHNTKGSWDCSCQEGLKAIETTLSKKECLDWDTESQTE